MGVGVGVGRTTFFHGRSARCLRILERRMASASGLGVVLLLNLVAELLLFGSSGDGMVGVLRSRSRQSSRHLLKNGCCWGCTINQDY